MDFHRKATAVAPVLATLLMIAVAVAMSVILFMWSQGFLSGSSNAIGGQQGEQNQAAQSSISIEAVVFTTGNSGTMTIILRNVGAVAVTLGSIGITAPSSNSGFTGSVIATLASGSWTVTSSDPSKATLNCWSASGGTSQLAKGQSATIILTRTDASCTDAAPITTVMKSGDTMQTKATTTVGTFASESDTIP